MSVGNKITLYMNGEKLGEALDNSYAAGFFGVFVLSRTSDDYTVKFDAMKFWENPKLQEIKIRQSIRNRCSVCILDNG